MFYYWPSSAIDGEILWQNFAANPCPATSVRIVPGIFCRFEISLYRVPFEVPVPWKVVTTRHWLLAAFLPAHPQSRCAYKYWASHQCQNDPWCIAASWGSFRFLPQIIGSTLGFFSCFFLRKEPPRSILLYHSGGPFSIVKWSNTWRPEDGIYNFQARIANAFITSGRSDCRYITQKGFKAFPLNQNLYRVLNYKSRIQMLGCQFFVQDFRPVPLDGALGHSNKAAVTWYRQELCAN